MRKGGQEPNQELVGALRELAPGLRFLALRTLTLPPATHTNCVFLGQRDLVVVDPGTPWPEEQATLAAAVAALADAGARVREIWLTHHHRDHVDAAAWLAAEVGVPIAAHARTARLLADALPVSRGIEDGETLALDGVSLQALHTPGHASGHLCLYDHASGALVAGDMVAGVGTVVVDPPDGDMGAYVASLERLRALGPRVVLPAHGEPIPDGAAKLDEYLAHRLWREQRVADALAAVGPASAADLVPDVYADVAPASFPLAERSLLAHLLKLVEDGRAERVDGRFRAS